MNLMAGKHSDRISIAATPEEIRRSWISAWIVTIAMGATTMTFQIYHDVTSGHMPWPLAGLEGIGPLFVAILVLHIVGNWRDAPLAYKTGAYAVMGGAMYWSATATGAVVLRTAAPGFSWLFGGLLDGAELLAAYFIMTGKPAAEARAKADAEAAQRAASERAAADDRASLRAEVDALRARVAHAETARVEADRLRAEAVQETAQLRDKLDAQKTAQKAARAARNPRAAKGTAAPRATRAEASEGEVDARTKALRILSEQPHISGAKLGPAVGMSRRWGQDHRAELAELAAAFDGNEADADVAGESPQSEV